MLRGRVVRPLAAGILLVVATAMLGWALYPVAAAQVPDPNATVFWVGPLTITPATPPAGTEYTVTGMIHSRHPRPLLIRATIVPPPHDVPRDAVQTRRVEANSDMSFIWVVYCGEPGGTVNVKIDIIREL